jgi:hypothetical protein
MSALQADCCPEVGSTSGESVFWGLMLLVFFLMVVFM